MLKLLKYEFRKARTVLFTLLGVAAALEGYFLYSLYTDQMDHLLIAIMLLAVGCYGAGLCVLVQGVTAYARELKSRSAYLIFMTPRSGLSIMGSKYVYAFALSLLTALACGVLAAFDLFLFFRHHGEWELLWRTAREWLSAYGLYVDQLALSLLGMAVYGFLSLLSFFALTYLALTLSHTLFRDKKWRGPVAFLLFLALAYGVSLLTGLFPAPAATVTLNLSGTAADVPAVTATLSQVLRALIPSGLISLGVILLSLFGCAWMLDRKVSL